MTVETIQEHPEMEQGQVRVQLWFGPHLLHNYRADAAAAMEYATTIGQRFPGLAINVDSESRPDLPPLPCQQLWSVLTP